MSGASAGWIGIVRCRPHFALRTRSNSWRSYLKPTSFRGRRCFLGAYAPVAVEDLSRWFGGSRRVRGARMLAALGEEAVEVDV